MADNRAEIEILFLGELRAYTRLNRQSTARVWSETRTNR